MGLTNNLGKLSNMITSTGSAVGIGTTTPSYLLDVQANNATFTSRIRNLNTTTDSAGLLVQAGVNSGNEIALFRNAAGTNMFAVFANGYFSSTPSASFASGNFDIWNFLAPNQTTTGVLSLNIGKSLSTYNNASIKFAYAGNSSTSNRLGIGFYDRDNILNVLASGFVGIGTTAPTRPLMVESSNSGTTRIHNTRNLTGSVISTWELGGTETNATSSYYLYCDTDSVGVRMVIYGNGNLANINGTYGTYSSDIRLKENIIPATSKLEDLMKLNVVNFNFKEDEKKMKQIGFIAQEMQEVFPSFVYENDTRKYDEDGNVISGLEDSLGLKVGMEFAILVKTIQELSAKVTALENK